MEHTLHTLAIGILYHVTNMLNISCSGGDVTILFVTLGRKSLAEKSAIHRDGSE